MRVTIITVLYTKTRAERPVPAPVTSLDELDLSSTLPWRLPKLPELSDEGEERR